SRNWGPIGYGNSIAGASIPREGASGWAIGQFPIQINSPNTMRRIQLVGLAKDAEIDAKAVVRPAGDDCLRQGWFFGFWMRGVDAGCLAVLAYPPSMAAPRLFCL